jgi:hypothetical protein
LRISTSKDLRTHPRKKKNRVEPADKAAEKVAELKLEECPLETEEIEASGAATGENGTDQYAESNEGLGAKGKPKKKK